MRITILSSYYWPEHSGNAPYVTGLAEYLASLDHDVTVSTGFPHYPAWSRAETGLLRSERRNDVLIRRRLHYVPRSQSAIRRGLYEMSLGAGSVTALPLRRPDLVVAVMPTLAVGVVGSLTAAARGSRFAVIFQDLQGRAAEQTGIRGGARIARAVGEVERQVARRADVVGVVAESFRPFLLEGGVPSGRIQRFRNWSEFSEPTESVAEARSRFGWREGEFVCLHAGNMGQKQGLENVLNAAALPGLDGIKFVLAGNGNERNALERGAKERGLRNVQFVDMQPMGGPCEAMCRAADVLLVNQRAAVLDMSLPSKLTTYFAAGRPVIAAVHADGETASEVRESAAGRVVAPDDPAALRDVLVDAVRGSWDLAASAAAGAAYARRVLSREAALSHIGDVLLVTPERCAASTGTPKSSPSFDAP